MEESWLWVLEQVQLAWNFVQPVLHEKDKYVYTGPDPVPSETGVCDFALNQVQFLS